MANRNYANGGRLYSMNVKPVLLNASFTIARTNTNGVGNINQAGSLIGQIFTNTSQTKAVYKGVTNNVASGYAQVFFAPNFNNLLTINSSMSAPLSGSNIAVTSALTVGSAYVITAVGTTTQAQWQALGLPPGIPAQVGASFIASSATPVTGTGQVQIPTAAGSGVNAVEIVGNPNVTLANSAQPSNGGGYVILRFLAGATPGVVQPADGTVVRLEFLFNDSSVVSGGVGFTTG